MCGVPRNNSCVRNQNKVKSKQRIMRAFSNCFLSCSTSLLNDIVCGTLAYKTGPSWAGELEPTPPGLPIPSSSRPGGSGARHGGPETVWAPKHPSRPLFPTQPGRGPALLVEFLLRGSLAICPHAGDRSRCCELQGCLIGWALQIQLWTVGCRGAASGAWLLLCPLGSLVWLDAGAGRGKRGTCHLVLLP